MRCSGWPQAIAREGTCSFLETSVEWSLGLASWVWGGGEPLGAEALAAMIHRQRAIEVGVDVDASPRIAAMCRPRQELDEPLAEAERVVLLDRALILEAADAVEIRGRWAPRWRRLHRGLREAGIEARAEAVKHPLRRRARGRLREAQFGDESILEGAEEPLDPALGLRGMRANPPDAQFLQGPPHLRGGGAPAELLRHGQRRPRIAMEDPVSIRIRGTREAIAHDEPTQEEEVAVGVLLVPKDPVEDGPRSIVDRSEQDEVRATVLEPRMMTAVHLDQQAGLGHALAAAAMPRGTPGPGTAQASGPEPPLHRGARDVQPLPLGQQVGELVIIDAGIRGARQREHPRPDGLRQTAGRGSATVPMGQDSDAVLVQRGKEPADMTVREAQQGDGFSHTERPMLDLGQYLHALLLLLSQRDRLPGHGARMTESLSC